MSGSFRMSDAIAVFERPPSTSVGGFSFRRVGRPFKRPTTPPIATRSITLNLPVPLVEQLQELAEQEQTSLSQMVRVAICRELQRRGLCQPAGPNSGPG